MHLTRLVEGREKPIDILAKNIILLKQESEEKSSGSKVLIFISKIAVLLASTTILVSQKTADTSSLEVELREPHLIFEGLDQPELQELLGDIRTYSELEADGPNSDFWQSLQVICMKEIEVATNGGRHSSGVHSSVMDELTSEFSTKSASDLEDTRSDIQAKLDSNDGSLDVEFWEGVLEQLALFRAKADVKEFHQMMLQQWLKVIEKKQADLEQYRAEHPEQVKAEDEARAAKVLLAKPQGNVDDISDTAGAMFRAEAAKGLDDLEEELGLRDEVKMEQVYWWQDKYRPRKPRYFNRYLSCPSITTFPPIILTCHQTGSKPVTSGTSTTKPIMITTTHLQKLVSFSLIFTTKTKCDLI
jgi:hypothetical protein